MRVWFAESYGVNKFHNMRYEKSNLVNLLDPRIYNDFDFDMIIDASYEKLLKMLVFKGMQVQFILLIP